MGMSLHRGSDKYCSLFGYFEPYVLKIGVPYIESNIYIGLTRAAKKLKS
jgi:hypothetical protein